MMSAPGPRDLGDPSLLDAPPPAHPQKQNRPRFMYFNHTTLSHPYGCGCAQPDAHTHSSHTDTTQTQNDADTYMTQPDAHRLHTHILPIPLTNSPSTKGHWREGVRLRTTGTEKMGSSPLLPTQERGLISIANIPEKRPRGIEDTLMTENDVTEPRLPSSLTT